MICSTGSNYTYLPFKKMHSKDFRYYFFLSSDMRCYVVVTGKETKLLKLLGVYFRCSPTS